MWMCKSEISSTHHVHSGLHYLPLMCLCWLVEECAVFQYSLTDWRALSRQMQGNSLMGHIRQEQLQSIAISQLYSIAISQLKSIRQSRGQWPLLLSLFRVSQDWLSLFRNWIQCGARGMFTGTTLDHDVHDKNAFGLWEIKSWHFRWMKASVRRVLSTLFPPQQELLHIIKKRGQNMTRMLRMLNCVWTVNPWGLRRGWWG